MIKQPKVKGRVSLDGWPDKTGTITEVKRGVIFSGYRLTVKWDDGKTTHNFPEVLNTLKEEMR